MVEFTVYGNPVAQGRPRAGKTRGGKTVLYDPTKSKNFKQYVKMCASQHRPDQLLEGPLVLIVKVYKPTLKNFSKRKTQEAEEGIIRPVTKPDLDNYLKGISDALNQVIWHDDSQIVETVVSKYYSQTPRVEIQVKNLGEQVE
ncbi:RusA family crossover junction endodeoxyribonuclease [Rossellomorea vietnamensis]|uniref:RusA family crossover junction endodeoxyribonuclease n=1 Tax=Rossellomorea vietnamensis TaxID=218284 RepID=UPI00054DE447|nr:RusA family crossover junction endodeoxyribonuclease [Rossellomorea vietnamensis]